MAWEYILALILLPKMGVTTSEMGVDLLIFAYFLQNPCKSGRVWESLGEQKAHFVHCTKTNVCYVLYKNNPLQVTPKRNKVSIWLKI
jgi:hypothetical protein